MWQLWQSAPTWTRVLFEMTWQAVVLAVVIAIVIRLFGKALHPAWRFALWSLVAIRLCLPVMPESELSMFGLVSWNPATDTRTGDPLPNDLPTADEFNFETREADSVGDSAARHDFVPQLASPPLDAPRFTETAGPDFATEGSASSAPAVVMPSDSVVSATPTTSGELAQTAQLADRPGFFPFPLLLLVWLGGVALFLLRRAVGSWQLRRVMADWRLCQDERLLKLFNECQGAVAIRRGVGLYFSPEHAGPATTGVWHPRIVISKALADSLSPEQLRMVFRHELCHVRRVDVLWDLLLTLIVTVHWFNPAAWWARRQMRRERELACDVAVLRGATREQALSYGQLLVQLSRKVSPLPVQLPAMVARSDARRANDADDTAVNKQQPTTHTRRTARRQPSRFLERRIDMIAAGQNWTRTSTVFACLILIAIAGSGLTAASEQSEPVVVDPPTIAEDDAGNSTNTENSNDDTTGLSSPSVPTSPGDSNRAEQDHQGDAGATTQTDADAANPKLQAAPAQEPAPYFSLPVTTKLQQTLLRAPLAKQFVLVDGERLIGNDGNTIDIGKLNLDQFGRDLSSKLERNQNLALEVHLPQELRAKDRQPVQVLEYAMDRIVMRYGMTVPAAIVRSHTQGFNWSYQESIKFLQADGDEQIEEQAVFNNLAEAFPVKTRLSRYLTSPDVDCVITMEGGYINLAEEFPREMLLSLKDAANRVDVDQRRLARIYFSTDDTVLEERRQELLDELKLKLTDELNFEAVEFVAGIAYVNQGAEQRRPAAQAAALKFTDVYRVLPVTTQTQRALLRSDKVAAFVSVHGDALVTEDRQAVAPERFLLPELQGALDRILAHDGKPPRDVTFQISFDMPSQRDLILSNDLAAEVTRTFKAAIQQVLPDDASAVVTRRFNNDDRSTWQDQVGTLTENANEQAPVEDPFGDDVITILPVRTSLSQFLSERNVQGVVRVHQPVLSDGFPADVVASMKKFLPAFASELEQANPGQRKALHLEVWPARGLEDEGKFADWLFSYKGQTFISELGFDGAGARVGFGQMPAAPETTPRQADKQDEEPLTAFDQIYRVVPVVTDTQRALLRAPNANVFVAVAGGGLINAEGNAVPERFHFAKLKEGIAEVAGDAEPRVAIRVEHSPPLGSNEVHREIFATFNDCQAQLGTAEPPRVMAVYTSDEFRSWEGLSRLLELPDEGDVDETPVGNELITVFPVRTHVSQYLSSVTTRACVEIHQPIPFAEPLPDEIKNALEEFARPLGKDRDTDVGGTFKRIHFFATNDKQRRRVNGMWLMEEEGLQYLKTLGFDTSSVTNCASVPKRYGFNDGR